MRICACLYLLLISVVTLWAQDATRAQSATQPDATVPVQLPEESSDEMVTPTPVGEVGLPLSVGADMERKNYIRGGVGFETAYDTNMFTAGKNVAGIDYSILPSLHLEVTRPRTQLQLLYSSGFTMYHNYSDLNHIDHNLDVNIRYRLRPHVTLNLRESFVKAGYLQSLPDQNDINSTVGIIQKPNSSIIPPLAEILTNLTTAQLTYQLSPNSMVGANGTLSELWYSNNRSLAPLGPYPNGLVDSGTQAGEAFYVRRLSRRQYIGGNYEFQKFLAHPSIADTKAQSAILFYTLYLPPRLSVSVFGGPQRSDTPVLGGGMSSRVRMWSPELGASIGYRLRRINFAAGFSRALAEGGGLSSAVRSNTATGSVRVLTEKRLSVGLSVGYATNATLNVPFLPANSGHTVLGSVFLQQKLGQHMGIHFDYTRLHQTYNIVAIVNAPNQHRIEGGISYEFEKSLGR